jgi:tetratricopeptide (TPR) repeat protein
LVTAVAVVTIAFLVGACASGDEAAGHRAYEASKKATGDARRTQLKTAYIHYDRAVRANPNAISTKLRNRFLEMALVRAKMMLDEGSYTMDGIPLLMDCIDNHLADDVQHDLRQQYAAFLVQMGDSAQARNRFIDALAYYDKAIEKAADASPFKAKRAGVIKNVADENFEMGMMEWEAGQREKDESRLVKAEYYAKVALYFDSTHQRALKLLSDCYKANINTYSAYVTVMDGEYSDTLVFRRINKYDILLAIFATRGNTYQIRMHSNTFNPLRMRSEHFMLVDTNGRRYPANSGAKMDPDILDQEREALYTVVFPAIPRGVTIKKLIYENGPHYTEKNFF